WRDAAVSLRGAPAGGVLRRYRRREGPKGHAGPRDPHRGHQAREVRAGEIRGPLRKCTQGAAAQEAEGREDRTTEGACTYQCGEPDGSATPECAGGGRKTVKCKASPIEKGQDTD